MAGHAAESAAVGSAGGRRYPFADANESIAQALQDLSPRLREAIVLRYGQGMTYREISEVMGCPQKTAESRVRLGHQRLRKSLQPVGMGLLEELLRVH